MFSLVSKGGIFDAAMFDYNSPIIGLSYAKQFTDKLSMGATVKYYSEKIDVENRWNRSV
jgi:hypothetical protein